MEITWTEFERLNQLRELDIQQCSFCHQITILNLGWKPFKKLLCQACQKEHVLCLDLCLPVARNILGCHLYQEYKPVVREVVPRNKVMIERVVIRVGRNWEEQERLERLKIGIILVSEELKVNGKFCVWNV